MRRPLFGPFGPWVVRLLCGYELLALLPGSPFPTISQIVERHHWVGWLLLSALGHHWYVERVVPIPLPGR